MSDASRFFVHEQADSDLEDIFEYSVENFGFDQAVQYIYDIEKAFKNLSDNPKLGIRFDPDIDRYFYFPVGSHGIFYMPTNRGVEIFRILHKSMLPTLHL